MASIEAVLAVAPSPKTPTLDIKDLVANPKSLIPTFATPLSLKRMS